MTKRQADTPGVPRRDLVVTDRLSLRALGPADVDAIQALVSEFEVLRKNTSKA